MGVKAIQTVNLMRRGDTGRKMSARVPSQPASRLETHKNKSLTPEPAPRGVKRKAEPGDLAVEIKEEEQTPPLKRMAVAL